MSAWRRPGGGGLGPHVDTPSTASIGDGQDVDTVLTVPFISFSQLGELRRTTDRKSVGLSPRTYGARFLL